LGQQVDDIEDEEVKQYEEELDKPQKGLIHAIVGTKLLKFIKNFYSWA
jgi:hypothetical protein